MSLIIFLIILSVLVIVHEAGHFFVAKFFGIRVDEFGLGYPPKAKKLFTWRGTDFTLNWLPFGGFVKIFGENPTVEDEEESLTDVPPGAKFTAKNRGIQAAVLVAGVTANFVFASLLMSLGFMIGLPAPLGVSLPVEDPKTVITTVLPDSPAEIAGIRSGDIILSLKEGERTSELNPEAVAQFISDSKDPLTLEIKRAEKIINIEVTPKEGIVAGKKGIGVAMDNVGIVKLPFLSALYHGFLTTIDLTIMTAEALAIFISQAFAGNADLSQVTGPVGLVGIVGDVKTLGLVYIISFTALISINLSIINLIPFPALDGGRLLFVAIESIIRRPIPPRIFNVLNTVGFGILILLMIVVTFRDVTNLL